MDYLKFIVREKRLLTFGISFTLISSFGQTFFVSLFVPSFLEYHSLSNAWFGSLYSGATLGSALLLPYVGKWIDQVPLRKYSLFVSFGLVVACLTIAISWYLPILFLGLLLSRLFGQGLSGHTSKTTMARFFDSRRGKALSIASVGYPLGEGILPLMVTGLLSIFYWRWIWVGFALAILLLYTPGIQWLIKNSSLVNETEKKALKNQKAAPSTRYAYATVLKDYRFWCVLPTLIAPPFWGTALFLYQISIAEQFGWTTTLIASAFFFFAVARVLSSLTIGPLIDRFTAERLFPFYLTPFLLSLIVVYLPFGDWSAFVYMAGIGITMGTAGNVNSALWAEWYGTEIIGTIRSLFASLMVISTAASPFIMGWLIDINVELSSIILAAAISLIFAIAVSFLAWTKH